MIALPEVACDEAVQGTTAKQAERRRKRRLKIMQQVRLRPSAWVPDEFDEVLTSVNVSREGLYVVTERKGYMVGMRLFVTSPYSTAPGALNMEYLGQVVRVDRISGDRRGIAIHLLTPIQFKS